MSINCTHYACRNKYECEHFTVEAEARQIAIAARSTWCSDEEITERIVDLVRRARIDSFRELT
jgi:hypothetical protein